MSQTDPYADAVIPDEVRDDPEVMSVLLLALSDLPERVRDSWIDYRMVGLRQVEIAERDGVARQTISARVRAADEVVLAYLWASREAA